MKKQYLYELTVSHKSGDVAYTICAETPEQMQQELLNALYKGFVVQVANL